MFLVYFWLYVTLQQFIALLITSASPESLDPFVIQPRGNVYVARTRCFNWTRISRHNALGNVSLEEIVIVDVTREYIYFHLYKVTITNIA